MHGMAASLAPPALVPGMSASSSTCSRRHAGLTPSISCAAHHRFPSQLALSTKWRTQGPLPIGSRFFYRRGNTAFFQSPRTGREKRSNVTMAQLAQSGLLDGVTQAFQSYPPTWESSLVATATIVLLGSPVLLSGLTGPGFVSAYALGTISWRAFGANGFFIVALYFILGTAATKVKMQQKEKEGIAEQRKGRRGPASVWGSGTAGILCALGFICGVGGADLRHVWILGFIASFCTKISDTVSSEIGKGYGKTTYLVTTLSIVPRGTEGAMSLEGTLAGLVASIVLAGVAVTLQEIDLSGAIVCVLASQVANLCESYLGATLQGKAGYEWLNNDIVNILNISIGATVAILAKLALGS